jgi:AcrR family transcriptional regulator
MGRLPAQRRKEQLLECAAELFARRGYARATTAELAKAAGVTEPIIYRHFVSKRDLFVALIDRTAERTLEHWKERLAGARDPAERLRRLIGENPMVTEEGRAPYRVLLQAITETQDPDIRAAATKHFRDLHAFLTKEIRRAQEDRRIMRSFSAELIAWTLIHVGLGYGVLDAMGVEKQGEDQQGMHVQNLIERLLVGRGDGQ